jgi:PAS domain S-box-containing protein
MTTPPTAGPLSVLLRAPMPAFVFDAAGRLVSANPRGLSLAAGDISELTGRAFRELFEVDLPSAASCRDDGIPHPGAGPFGGRLRRGQGVQTEVEISSLEITDGAGGTSVICFANPRSEDLAKRLELTRRCAAEIMSVKPLSDVLMTVVRLMVEEAGADHATITLRDETTEEFVVYHEYPHDPARTLVGERIPIRGYPVQEQIVREQKRVVAADLARHGIVEESEKVAELTTRLRNQSMAILPMVCRNQVIGTISADSVTRRRTFSDDDLDMFETVANMAAAAIDNARSLERAEGLKNLYTEASSAFSLEHIAARLLADIRKIVICDKASVQLIVDGRRVLLSGYGFDKDKASPRLLGSITLDPIVNDIVTSRQMCVIPDTKKEKRWIPQPETVDVRSWVGIPLAISDVPLALITLDHSTPAFYDHLTNPTDATRNLLELFAARAAVDLQEAYLFDAAKHHIQSVALIDRIAECVGRSLNTERMLHDVAQEIKTRGLCDHCVAFLLESSGSGMALVPKASFPILLDRTMPVLEMLFDARRSASPTVAAAAQHNSIVVNNFTEAELYRVTPELPANTGSVLATPIRRGKRVIGVLTASRREVNAFGVSNQALLETVARHIGIALERNIGLALVEEVGQKVLRAPGMAEVLHEIVSGAMKLTNTDSGVIFTLNEKGTAIVEGFSPPGFKHPAPRLDNPNGITRKVIKDRAFVEIADITDHPHVNPALKERFKSMCAFPLTLTEHGDGGEEPRRERVVGVLYLNGVQAGTLSDTERAFVTTLANQAAIMVQRTRLDTQIRDREAIFRSLIDNIPQSVFRKNRDSIFTSANETFRRSLGLPLDQIIGRRDRDFYPPQMAEGFVADDQAVIATGQSLTKEERHHVLGSPGPKWVRVVKTPVRDSRDEITGVQAIFWDVTEEREHRDRYHALFEQSPDSILLHKDGIITMANPAAVALFGAASETELVGEPILSLVHSDDVPMATERLHRLSRNVEVQSVVMKVRAGTPIEVAVHARPLPDTAEVQVVFHDLTPVNTLLDEMHHRAASALHKVSGHISQEARRNPDRALQRVFAGVQSRIAAMMHVHQLLMHRRGTRRVPMQRYLVKLVDAVTQSYGSDCRIEVSTSAAEIELDEHLAYRVGLIVTELVANSLLHGFEGRAEGTIQVRMARDGIAYGLEVLDDGCGFRNGIPSAYTEICGLRLVDELTRRYFCGTIAIDHREPCGVAVSIGFTVPEQTEAMENGG